MAQLKNFRLKVFRAVAECPSFHKADLFLTQPAVTLQTKALENDLGMLVFDRAGRGISLTPQGSVLLRSAPCATDDPSAPAVLETVVVLLVVVSGN